MEKRYLSFSLPEYFAKFLTHLEVMTAEGMEERTNDVVEKVTGRPPVRFEEFVEENKGGWE